MNRFLAPALLASLAFAVAAKAQDPLPPATEKPALSARRSVPVRVISAAPRTFERRLSVQGSVVAKFYANVSARSAGVIEDIAVREGDPAVKGETLLFQIDPTRPKNALTIAKQNLAVAEASLAVARASASKVRAEARKAQLDFARYGRLHKDGKVTDNEFEAREVANEQASAGIAVADAQVDLAERQVKAAKASVAIAEKDLEDASVFAPLSGFVTTRSAEPGELASPGRVILRIEDTSVLEAAAFIPASYYPEVAVGRTLVRLAVAGRDLGQFPVTYRAPVVNPSLRTFEIKALLDGIPQGAAAPGAQADIDIVFDSRSAVGVPSAAIVTRSGSECVFVESASAVALRRIQTGLRNDGWTEIVSGVEPGERVVVEGQTLLFDGNPVTVSE